MKVNGRGIANIRAKYEDRHETSMFKTSREPTVSAAEWERRGVEDRRSVRVEVKG